MNISQELNAAITEHNQRANVFSQGRGKLFELEEAVNLVADNLDVPKGVIFDAKAEIARMGKCLILDLYQVKSAQGENHE